MLNGSNIILILVCIFFYCFEKITVCDQNEFFGKALGWSLVKNLALSFYNKKYCVLYNNYFKMTCTLVEV